MHLAITSGDLSNHILRISLFLVSHPYITRATPIISVNDLSTNPVMHIQVLPTMLEVGYMSN